jgi:hypothetical protein
MRLLKFAVIFIAVTTAAFAEDWQFGATGGFSLLDTVSASGTPGTATAGFAPGFVAGAFLGQTLHRNFSGEIHYEYMQSNLKLSSAGQKAQFSGYSNAIHYDVAYHTGGSESPVQFFVLLGGGIKEFAGTGAEEAYQPLSQFGYFTKTNQIKAMGTGAAGVTFALNSHLTLRAEVRDFVTPFPTGVLTPAPGVKFGSLLNDVVPMISLVYTK